MPELQHLKKFMKEVDATEVCQTPVITGDPKISWRMTHSAITSPKVRLSRNSPNPYERLSIKLAKLLPPGRMRRIQVIPSIGKPSATGSRGASSRERWCGRQVYTFVGAGTRTKTRPEPNSCKEIKVMKRREFVS